MTLLAHPALHVLVGGVPDRETLHNVAASTFATAFSQVVFLHSSNLVQLCNFIRRCRKEGGKRPYLVFLEFLPHRETWHLLGKARALNLTIVAMCRGRSVLELFGHQPVSVWEVLGSGNIGIRTPGAAWTIGGGAESEWAAASETYLTHPERHFSRMADATPTGSASHGQQQKQHAGGVSSATMTVEQACKILCIPQSDWNNAAAIKREYRRLALTLHPDKAKNRQTAAHEFSLLSEARALLLSQCT